MRFPLWQRPHIRIVSGAPNPVPCRGTFIDICVPTVCRRTIGVVKLVDEPSCRSNVHPALETVVMKRDQAVYTEAFKQDLVLLEHFMTGAQYLGELVFEPAAVLRGMASVIARHAVHIAA